MVNTALHRADAISLTKHFEGRGAPDKALDNALGHSLNWQMELIGPTGLKWATSLTFQRTEQRPAETPAPPPADPWLGAFPPRCLLIHAPLLSKDKTSSQRTGSAGPGCNSIFITISIYPISPSEMAASEAIFLNK